MDRSHPSNVVISTAMPPKLGSSEKLASSEPSSTCRIRQTQTTLKKISTCLGSDALCTPTMKRTCQHAHYSRRGIRYQSCRFLVIISTSEATAKSSCLLRTDDVDHRSSHSPSTRCSIHMLLAISQTYTTDNIGPQRIPGSLALLINHIQVVASSQSNTNPLNTAFCFWVSHLGIASTSQSPTTVPEIIESTTSQSDEQRSNAQSPTTVPEKLERSITSHPGPDKEILLIKYTDLPGPTWQTTKEARLERPPSHVSPQMM